MQNVVILKKFISNGTYLSVRGPEPHTLPPSHTEYVYTVYLFTKGRVGWGES
jgi:hypothetical protein